MNGEESASQPPISGGDAPVAGGGYPSEFWLRTVLRWYVGLVIRPGATVREILERRPLLAGVGTASVGIAVCGAAFFVAYHLLEYGSLSIDQFKSGEVDAIGAVNPLNCCIAISVIGAWSLNLHWIAERFGRRAGFLRTFSALSVISAIGYAVFSGGILAASLFISPGGPSIFYDAFHAATNVALGLVLTGLLLIGSLAVIMVKENYGLHPAKAALTVALSLLPTVILGYVAAMLLLVVSIVIALLLGQEVRIGN